MNLKKKTRDTKKSELLIYQKNDGKVKLEVWPQDETMWFSYLELINQALVGI